MSDKENERDNAHWVVSTCVAILAAAFAPDGWHLTVFCALFLLSPPRRWLVRHD